MNVLPGFARYLCSFQALYGNVQLPELSENRQSCSITFAAPSDLLQFLALSLSRTGNCWQNMAEQTLMEETRIMPRTPANSGKSITTREALHDTPCASPTLKSSNYFCRVYGKFDRHFTQVSVVCYTQTQNQVLQRSQQSPYVLACSRLRITLYHHETANHMSVMSRPVRKSASASFKALAKQNLLHSASPKTFR